MKPTSDRNDGVRERILALVADGHLPDGEEMNLAMRPGGRARCTACAERIRASQWHFVVTAPLGNAVGLCLGCFESWLSIRGESAWAGPRCYFCASPMRVEQHGLLINTVFLDEGGAVAHVSCLPEMKNGAPHSRSTAASRLCALCREPIVTGEPVVERGVEMVHPACDAARRRPISGGAIVSPLWAYEGRLTTHDMAMAASMVLERSAVTRRRTVLLRQVCVDARRRAERARVRSAAVASKARRVLAMLPRRDVAARVI